MREDESRYYSRERGFSRPLFLGALGAHILIAGDLSPQHVSIIFLDKGLHNPASTSRDVHSQKVQTKSGTETQQTKVKTRSID
jgi:hypothetical protein